MGAHQRIIEVGAALSYPHEDGLCKGFTVKWLEACLLSQENLFFERVKQIDETSASLPTIINSLKEKVKLKETLTQDELNLLEIPAFYEGIMLHQSPGDYEEVFNQKYYQRNLNQIFPFTASQETEKLGKMASIYSEACIYNEHEIAEYLNQLQKIIDSAEYASPVGFLIGTEDTSAKHATGVTYDPHKKKWTFMDINDWPPKEFSAEETHYQLLV